MAISLFELFKAGIGPAVMMGLEGERPDQIDPEQMPARLEHIRTTGYLLLAGQHKVRFREASDIVYYRRKSLPDHPNGMVCQMFDRAGQCLSERTYYSIGGGFVVDANTEGTLKIRRRAASLYGSLMDKQRVDLISPSLSALDWVNLYALTVNEENAAGGRIVTAPTNGAAGRWQTLRVAG